MQDYTTSTIINVSQNSTQSGRKNRTNGEMNKLTITDRPAHDWYRFVLSYPPHLVRHYLNKFELQDDDLVLDPFCGTGTTLVECKKCGIPSVGIEAHPMSHFSSQVKIDWSPDTEGLLAHVEIIAASVYRKLRKDGIEDDYNLQLFERGSLYLAGKTLRTLNEDQVKLLLTNCISPLPLHKSILLYETICENRDDRYYRHELLAFAKALVFSISNLNFGPEVGVSVIKDDAAVIAPWLANMHTMVDDLRELQSLADVSSRALHADARQIQHILTLQSIRAIITSPPYPNEKDYTRTTRLESVLLGFVKNRSELQALKRGLIRSNTRNVYKGDDDDKWIEAFPEIHRLAQQMEDRRIELGKTSGFERMYPRVTTLYFGGMARHLAELRPVLLPGAKLAYVVGDQASFLRVMIRTGQLLADIAKSLGYEVMGIDLFRTRLATATKVQLREEVVLLQWPG